MSRAGGNLVGGGGPAGDPGGSPWRVLETVPELFLETPMHLTFQGQFSRVQVRTPNRKRCLGNLGSLVKKNR